jgi:hypothetical protein
MPAFSSGLGMGIEEIIGWRRHKPTPILFLSVKAEDAETLAPIIEKKPEHFVSVIW